MTRPRSSALNVAQNKVWKETHQSESAQLTMGARYEVAFSLSSASVTLSLFSKEHIHSFNLLIT